MVRIAIVIGSTRPGRRGAAVAQWVGGIAARHPATRAGEAAFDLVDLADYDLPLLDEPLPAKFADYRRPHTARWAAAVDSFDGFVFVTPEYNHSMTAALKNAIDFLCDEWRDKAAGFVSYGTTGGTRAVEHLRQVLGELHVADVRTQVALSVYTDFTITDPRKPGDFTPAAHHESIVDTMLSEVVAWSRALQSLRDTARASQVAPT